MYKQMIARYIDMLNEYVCAAAIFTEDGKILHLNNEALGILGRNVINLEFLPGRYVENEDLFQRLLRYHTIFVHKALLKAGTESHKIRGMMHLLCERDEEQKQPMTYALMFEVREERIFGSVTLERIIENSGFVAFHWVAKEAVEDEWDSRYVSNSVSKFGYKREDFYEGKVTWKAFIYEDDWEPLKTEVLDNIAMGKFEFSRQYRVVGAEGQIIPVHDYIHVIVDNSGKLVAAEIVIFDLLMETERNADLLLLGNALNRSRSIVLVWQYISKKSQEKRVRYVSMNMDQFGIAPSKLRNGDKDYFDYVHPEDIDTVRRMVTQFEQKGYLYLSQEYRLINDKQEEFWVRDESNIIELPDGTRYLESILTDISGEKRRELQLIEQQEQLERKIRYIEDDNTLLSDMSVVDFISKEELQDLQSAFAAITGSYNAVIDLDGEPITFPDGPEENMGAFYDMFERSEYKRGYFELNKRLRKEKQPVKMTLREFTMQELQEKKERAEIMPKDGSLTDLIKATSREREDATAGVVIGFPLYIDDKHLTTWINCAFTNKEMETVDQCLPALWHICRYMAQFVYSNTVSQKQAQMARYSEVHARELLERNSVIRDILRRCNETNDENAIEYVLYKAGNFLNLSRISLFRYQKGDKMPACVSEWDCPGMERNIDKKAVAKKEDFSMQEEAFERDGKIILNGDKIPIRIRRILWDSHVRAIVSMPIQTLTREHYFISFVESNYERIWEEEELSFMQTIVNILQGYLQRMRSNVNVQDVIATQKEFVKMSREYIYLKDEGTGEIVYVNPRLEEVIGKEAVGKRCYEVFRRQSIRCMDCNQKKGECNEICGSRMYQRFFKEPMRVRQMYVSWEGVRHLKMVMFSPEGE